jgi:hypothetical protein
VTFTPSRFASIKLDAFPRSRDAPLLSSSSSFHTKPSSLVYHYTMARLWITAFLLGGAVTASATAINPELRSAQPHGLLGRRAPSPDILTDNIVPLKTVLTPPIRRSNVFNRRSLSASNNTSNNTTTIANNFQLNYVADVQWGNQTFSMLLDSGSSDTWVLQEGFQCINSTGNPVAVRHLQACFLSFSLRT